MKEKIGIPHPRTKPSEDIIKSEEIEGGKAFLEGILRELEANIKTDRFQKCNSDYHNALIVYNGIIPKDELDVIRERYDNIIGRGWKEDE